MKITATPLGLLTAIVIVCSPVLLCGQQASSASPGDFYGGSSNYGDAAVNLVAPQAAAPYGYLWNGYCVEAAQRYACRMQHAMNAAAIASQAPGACPAEKFCIMKESISASLNPFAPCGHCPSCQSGKAMQCGNCKLPHYHQESLLEESPQPAQPELPDSANSNAFQPAEDPVVLTPVQPSMRPIDNDDPTADNSEPTTNTSARSPVVRLAPAAPRPSEVRPRNTQREPRIPRNEIPRRPENPSSPNDRRSAAIPVNTTLYNGTVRLRQ